MRGTACLAVSLRRAGLPRPAVRHLYVLLTYIVTISVPQIDLCLTFLGYDGVKAPSCRSNP